MLKTSSKTEETLPRKDCSRRLCFSITNTQKNHGRGFELGIVLCSAPPVVSAVWFPAQVMLHTVVAATAAPPTLFLIGRKTSESRIVKELRKKNKCRLFRKFPYEYNNNPPSLWPLVRFSSKLVFSNVLCWLHFVFLSMISYIYVAGNMEGCLPSNILCNLTVTALLTRLTYSLPTLFHTRPRTLSTARNTQLQDSTCTH